MAQLEIEPHLKQELYNVLIQKIFPHKDFILTQYDKEVQDFHLSYSQLPTCHSPIHLIESDSTHDTENETEDVVLTRSKKTKSLSHKKKKQEDVTMEDISVQIDASYLTTHEGYFERFCVFLDFLKKLNLSDVPIVPIPELPSCLTLPKCRANFTIKSAEAVHSCLFKSQKETNMQSFVKLHKKLKHCELHYRNELSQWMKDPNQIDSYPIFKKELSFLDQVDFVLDIIDFAVLNAVDEKDQRDDKPILRKLAEKLSSRYESHIESLSTLSDGNKPLDLPTLWQQLLKLVLERKLNNAISLLKQALQSGLSHPCFSTLQDTLQSHLHGSLSPSLKLACQSWSERALDESLKDVFLSLLGEPIDTLTFWHEYVSILSYRTTFSFHKFQSRLISYDNTFAHEFIDSFHAFLYFWLSSQDELKHGSDPWLLHSFWFLPPTLESQVERYFSYYAFLCIQSYCSPLSLLSNASVSSSSSSSSSFLDSNWNSDSLLSLFSVYFKHTPYQSVLHLSLIDRRLLYLNTWIHEMQWNSLMAYLSHKYPLSVTYFMSWLFHWFLITKQSSYLTPFLELKDDLNGGGPFRVFKLHLIPQLLSYLQHPQPDAHVLLSLFQFTSLTNQGLKPFLEHQEYQRFLLFLFKEVFPFLQDPNVHFQQHDLITIHCIFHSLELSGIQRIDTNLPFHRFREALLHKMCSI